MGKMSPKVDAYIAKSAEFARPILNKLRQLMHQACPDVTETIKWGFPHFEYKGLLASMAAFKQHASFGFWKGSLLSDPAGFFRDVGKTTMNARRLTKLADLPPDKIVMAYIHEAVELNEKEVKPPRPKKKGKPPLEVPDFLATALKKNKKAKATFDAFSPSHQREYIEWLTEAKQEATRQKRLATALAWLAEGKSRHWRYQKGRK